MRFVCCLRELNKHALHGGESRSRRLPYREKDESHIVISIDFKTDLIDLFKGNQKAGRRCKAVNLIREFPSNLMLKLLIILKEKLRRK